MKKLLVVFILFCALHSFGQNQDFHYQFALAGVVDLPTAKEIKDPLRAKFLCYTVYNEATQKFDFVSSVNVNQNQLQEYLDAYGYTITSFQKLPVVAQNQEEKQ